MVSPAVAERPHGYARYRLDGCRCYTCGYAVSEYERKRQGAIAAGTWTPFVDATPVRQHLAELAAAGIGYKRAAALAGVGRTVVAGLLFGRSGRPPAARCRPETAARLLAIRPTAAAAAPHAVIDGTGTARRIQALCCLGWSLTAQATRVGWSIGNFAALAKPRPVTTQTALAVARVYDALSMTPAPPGYSATRTRRFAADQGWVPPLAWDDDSIDNPAAGPIGVAAAPDAGGD